jgi:hypothetical protein
MMADFSTNPSSLTIDEETGVLSLENTANIKQSYDIIILVTNLDGYNEIYTNPIEIPMTVETVCGPESTVLSWPTSNGFMDNLYKAPHTSPPLETSGPFTSANVQCPVESHSLTSGSSNFYLLDYGTDFTVVMKDSAKASTGQY